MNYSGVAGGRVMAMSILPRGARPDKASDANYVRVQEL